MVYKQPREAVAIQLRCDRYLIQGDSHLVPGRPTGELFNVEGRAVVAVTDARIYDIGFEDPPPPESLLARASFLAINRHEVLWVAGGRPSTVHGGSEARVGLLFNDHLLSGYMQLMRGRRLTDQLQAAGDFVTVLRATVFPLQPGVRLSKLSAAYRLEFVNVNTHRVVAAVEG